MAERSSSTPTNEGDGDIYAFARKEAKEEVQSTSGQERCVKFKVEECAPIQDTVPFRDRLQSNDDAIDNDSFCFNIPVYCFDCPLSALTTIGDVSEKSEDSSEDAKKRREDVFQDFTQSAAQIFMDPFSLDEMPRLVEGRTYGHFGNSKDLLLHCNAVHDLFFRSFVSCIFASLQCDQHVSSKDVHSAVEACEENFLEIDITDFIRTLCGHYVNCMKKEESAKGFFPIRPSPVFLDGQQSYLLPTFSKVRAEECVRELQNALSVDCKSVPGLHGSITAKFMSLLDRHFKAVASCGEFYFYCPQLPDNTRKVGSVLMVFVISAHIWILNFMSSSNPLLHFLLTFLLLLLYFPTLPPFCTSSVFLLFFSS